MRPSKLADLLPQQCNMAAWASPLHFRAHVPRELPRTFALKKTSRSGQQARSTNAQTRKSGSEPAQRNRRRARQQRRRQAQKTAVQSFRLKTTSAGRSPCGTGSRPRQSPPQPPKRRTQRLTRDRCTKGAPSRCSIGWSCRCSTIIQYVLSKRPDSERSSGHVHPEQELWRRNCALFLGVCAEGRAEEKALGAAEQGEACQTGLQRHH